MLESAVQLTNELITTMQEHMIQATLCLSRGDVAGYHQHYSALIVHRFTLEALEIHLSNQIRKHLASMEIEGLPN